MLSAFKILVTCLIISSRCTCIPIPNGETTTLTFKEKIEQELDPLKDDLKKMIDPLTSNNDKAELKGQLQGRMEKIIERAVKYDQLLTDKGHLEQQMHEADKYKILLALTHRVDDLERSFHPNPILSGDRFLRWKNIFALNTPMVKELRDKVTAAGMTEEQFCRKVQTLCNERNDRAGHAAVELPTFINEHSIQDALYLMKIPADKTTKETLRILISPFESGDLISAK